MKPAFGLLMIFCTLLILAISITAVPVPAALPQSLPQAQAHQMGQAKASGTAAKPPQASGSNSSSGPYIPLPESGETLLSYLDRLLSGLPLLGNLLVGLGYVRSK